MFIGIYIYVYVFFKLLIIIYYFLGKVKGGVIVIYVYIEDVWKEMIVLKFEVVLGVKR